MSAGLVPPLEVDSETLPRKRFTRQDVDRLTEAGVFEGQRYELIDGDLIDKTGQRPPHAISIQLLLDAFVALLGASLVRVQLPMEASGKDRERSLPEPDFAVLKDRKPEFHQRHPRGDELLLVVEVSDTTARFDLSRKAELYAAAGVPEYWVLDLQRRMLIVHRQSDGAIYRLQQLLSERDTVTIEGRSESLRVADILPQA